MGRLIAAVATAARRSNVEPDPAALPLLAVLAARMHTILAADGGELTDDSDLDNNAALNAIGHTASRYATLGVRELTAIVAAGAPFREEVTAELPASHRQAALDAARRPPTKPDYWPGPLGYATALHDAVVTAEREDDGSDVRRAYMMGLRVAAALYGLPAGAAPADRAGAEADPAPVPRFIPPGGPPPAVMTEYRRLCAGLDLEPVFVIRGKDQLAPATIDAYRQFCVDHGLAGQVIEVTRAYVEIRGWQRRHPGRVKLPDHKHVPVGGDEDG